MAGQTLVLDSTKGLQPHDVTVAAATYRGRMAVRVMPDPAADVKTASGGGIVVLPVATFHNGIIELQVAGKPGAGASGDARGFVGVAFRVSNDSSKYECFYLRPTNGLDPSGLSLTTNALVWVFCTVAKTVPDVGVIAVIVELA